MEEKKEVQATIIPKKNNGVKKEEFLNILKLASPGTSLRTALEGIVSAGKGAIIVVENDSVQGIIDGGFKLNCRVTPQRLIELSKMDGAIIVSKDMKRITHANALLTPDHKIPTNETGTRHKAAERSAIMTGTLVIAVSERKREINIYYKTLKYPLRDTSEILRRTTETLQILEKQRELFDVNLLMLNQLEIDGNHSIEQATKVIQKGKAMQRIMKSIDKNIIELGNESHSIRPRMKEIMKDVEKETDLVVKDYTRLNLKKSKKLLESLSYDEIIEQNNILIALAQKEARDLENIKGWRILSKAGLMDQDISLLLKDLVGLKNILNSDKNTLTNIIGEDKAALTYNEIQKIKSNNFRF